MMEFKVYREKFTIPGRVILMYLGGHSGAILLLLLSLGREKLFHKYFQIFVEIIHLLFFCKNKLTSIKACNARLFCINFL